ncbi:peptidoglycan DD-metalloendopeptidase family protein [Pedobacter faecalis]|uniref:peptidoglycan DD-metalloendopeptidase family protein n=1 Tax=Pedobacter faecalis TaxID=3041495 RepID=UPI002550CC68|nr:peptidoglycan DD-metalloendopeptidase family protein [Pedobacter sp. ELA7]
MIRILSVFIIWAIVPIFAYSQPVWSNNKYPLVDFRQPLDIKPPALSGSFGELRSNHFHSGLDFRTNQREGYPVFAVADGFVSRLRVQNGGFGLALYVNHPNGFTSVYAHLQRFGPEIADQVKRIQYHKKSFEVDELVDSSLLPVRKGQVIAYSGNTGGSAGPHLHFEIRDSKTEATINPQLFGIEIPDNVPPVIHSLYVYRLNHKVFNELTPKQYFRLIGSAGNYRIHHVTTLRLGGEVGFGIVTNDRHTGASGLNGVYAIQLELDGTVIYSSSMERFEFVNSRAINAHIDYPHYLKTKISIQKSFVDPGNPLKIYSNVLNYGRVTFNDGKLHRMKYTVIDGRGNKSTLTFNVQSDNQAVIKTPEVKADTIFKFTDRNEYIEDDVRVILTKGTLYNDVYFSAKKLPRQSYNVYSSSYQIHNNKVPLHTGFELWIKADSTLIPYQEKAVILNASGISQGGSFEDGYVKATPRTFGNYYISVDTIAPTITPLNISEGKRMGNVSKVTFKIRDDLSGLKSFNGYIDDKWVLMEFDAKTATLWHTFDDLTLSGKHTFKLVVTDMKNNAKTYNVTFYK